MNRISSGGGLERQQLKRSAFETFLCQTVVKENQHDEESTCKESSKESSREKDSYQEDRDEEGGREESARQEEGRIEKESRLTGRRERFGSDAAF